MTRRTYGPRRRPGGYGPRGEVVKRCGCRWWRACPEHASFHIPVAEGQDVLIDTTPEAFEASVQDALTKCRERIGRRGVKTVTMHNEPTDAELAATVRRAVHLRTTEYPITTWFTIIDGRRVWISIDYVGLTEEQAEVEAARNRASNDVIRKALATEDPTKVSLTRPRRLLNDDGSRTSAEVSWERP